MIDLKQMQAAFLLQWVGRLFQAQALGNWNHVPKNIVAPFGDKYLCFFLNLRSRAFKGLQMITSHFWNSVLKTWLDLNCHDPSMPVPTLLWNNSHIKYQGNALMKDAKFYARLCSVSKWFLEQEVWITNRRIHKVSTIISNDRNKATGSTVENSA